MEKVKIMGKVNILALFTTLLFISGISVVTAKEYTHSVNWSCDGSEQNMSSALCSATIVEQLRDYEPNRTMFTVWSRAAISNPNITIQYHSLVTNADTGESVPCDSNVPLGTKLNFEFKKHVFTDISWFATGFYFDSPYGDWIDNASKPYADMCANLPEKDFVGHRITTNRGLYKGIVSEGDIYTSLSIAPPVKTLNGINQANCSEMGENGKTCTMSEIGVINPKFGFSQTTGYFYARTNVTSGMHAGSCFTSNEAMRRVVGFRNSPIADTVPYSITMPAQVISCPITVIDPNGTAPNSPTITSNGTCVVGNAFTMNVTATDPDAQATDPESGGANTDKSKIKFAIDWTGNGVTDQVMPSSGLLASGSIVTLSRTYATSGEKSVRVRTVDGEGLSSPWVNATFNCAQSSDSASGMGGFTTIGGDGNQSDAAGDPEWAVGNDPKMEIQAFPSLVRKGHTSIVQWRTYKAQDCLVTGSNGDGPWETIQGTETTSGIEGRTTYTLTCNDEAGNALDSQSVVVNIIPTWNEQ